MTYVIDGPTTHVALRPADRDRADRDPEEGTMLLQEALVRIRAREAEETARQYRLARRLTAGRRWAKLAGYAARRAARARSRAG